MLSPSVVSDSCDPVDCNLPGSSVHGIFQARILEWVAISFSRGSSWPRNQTQVSCIAVRLFTDWATIPFCSSVMSNSFWPHGLQHTRLPCPSPTPGAYSNSCLISWWPHEQFEKELQGKPNKTLSLLPNEILFSPCGMELGPYQRKVCANIHVTIEWTHGWHICNKVRRHACQHASGSLLFLIFYPEVVCLSIGGILFFAKFSFLFPQPHSLLLRCRSQMTWGHTGYFSVRGFSSFSEITF